MSIQPLILVVDHEQDSLEHITNLLKASGYNTASANDAIKGLASCRVRVPAAILMSLNMPLMSGREMLNRLKADQRTEDIPVIFLLTEADTQSSMSLWVLDDYEFLVKPVSDAELLVRVKANLRTKRLKDDIRKKDKEIKELSLVDSVTQLKNARYFSELLKSQVVQSRRYKMPLSVIILESDQFKDIQRSNGQAGIDSLASQLAAVLIRGNRESDIAARISANEFAIMLPNTDAQGAELLANRLRQSIAESTFTVGTRSQKTSISIGIGSLEDQDDTDGKSIMTRARQAIAKNDI